MKHTIILFFAIVPILLFSQGLDYRKWEYPTVKIRGFQLDNYYRGNSDLKLKPDNKNYFETSSFGSIGVNYSIFRNEAIIQNQKYMSFSTSFSDNSVRYSLGYLNYYRKYFGKGDHKGIYYELRPNVDLNFGNQNYDNYKNYNLNLQLKIGKGRIEPMRDVFIAQFMIDDLVAEHLMDSIYDQNLIFQLANEMILTRSKRVFDGRMARKFQLKRICDFLVDKGIDESIDLFNVVNDHWFNTVYNERSVGQRISVGILSRLQHEYRLDEGTSSSSKYGYVGVLFDYNYTKPINQYWQKIFNASVGLAQDPDEKEDRGYSVESEFELTYYPTTRTYYTVSANTNYTTLDFKQVRLLASLTFSTSIFITNTIRINGNISMFRNINRIDESSEFYKLSRNYDNFFDKNNFSRYSNYNFIINDFSIQYGISLGYIFF